MVSVAATLTVTGPAAATTWTHSQTGGYDVWYLNGTTQKFRYNLANQQWSHFSTIGSSWYTISSTGRSNTFIGDGHWFDLGNGFSYQYSAGYDKGTFKDGSAHRFCTSMLRASGTIAPTPSHGRRWVAGGLSGLLGGRIVVRSGKRVYLSVFGLDTIKARSRTALTSDSCTSMVQVSGTIAPTPSLGRRWGTAGLNAGFLGDGHWRDLGNGFTYQYSAWCTTRARSRTASDGSVLVQSTLRASGTIAADTLSWQALGAGWTAMRPSSGAVLVRSGKRVYVPVFGSVRQGHVQGRLGKYGSCTSMLRASGPILPTPFHGRRWGPEGSMRHFVGDGALAHGILRLDLQI